MSREPLGPAVKNRISWCPTRTFEVSQERCISNTFNLTSRGLFTLKKGVSFVSSAGAGPSRQLFPPVRSTREMG